MGAAVNVWILDGRFPKRRQDVFPLIDHFQFRVYRKS